MFILKRILAVIFSLSLFANTIPMTISGFRVVVDEQTLVESYQNESWDGSLKQSARHSAEVKDGMLVVDGKESKFPADSSLSYFCPKIASTGAGTWYVDPIGCTLNLDNRGKNLFSYSVVLETWGMEFSQEFKGDKKWTAFSEGDKIVVLTRKNGEEKRYERSLVPEI